jgi:hypothetical protein
LGWPAEAPGGGERAGSYDSEAPAQSGAAPARGGEARGGEARGGEARGGEARAADPARRKDVPRS